jgi:hypothetical protein
MYNKEKKIRDKSLTKRFNSTDVMNWQKEANQQTGGNLTLWIELTLNKEIIKKNTKSKI